MAGVDVLTLALAKNYADEHDGRAMDSETKAAIVQEVVNAIDIPEVPSLEDIVDAVIEELPDGDSTEY